MGAIYIYPNMHMESLSRLLGFQSGILNQGVINILTKVLCFEAMRLDKMTKKERKMEKECHLQMELEDMPTFRSWRE